ncbi:hypothetical protein SAMN04488057_104101 [Cyclobacterium lianum]|uniref:Uncharacterized protein n=1 Tax=Cyclobacterium lianum TaxID=388280 RepID=A0A1M7M694_9BACT|nr:hypothetical protein [Cyclobacterium lianum]SHM85764.1 hypothetical protein SAMN04488057_104101 [Cyclobacterium lianum]
MYILFKRQSFVLFLIFIFGCETYREDPETIGSPFYPFAMGNFWEYSVEETVYFGEGDAENRSFYYRDEMVDQYLNADNELVYKIQRKSSPDRINWFNERIFTVSLSRNRIIRQDDNLQEIILVYPADTGREWDGNALNNKLMQTFVVEREGDYILGNLNFAETITVRQREEDDLITIRDNRYEVFAKNIGLVEKYYEVFRYCSRNDCLGEQIIQEGRFTHLKLIGHGQM